MTIHTYKFQGYELLEQGGLKWEHNELKQVIGVGLFKDEFLAVICYDKPMLLWQMLNHHTRS